MEGFVWFREGGRELLDTIKKKAETLIDAGKEVGLEVNAERAKYMLVSRHQNEGQHHNIKMVS
jgi:hypothetical protein